MKKLLSSALLAITFSTVCMATPRFARGPIQLKATVGMYFQQNLNNFLIDRGIGDLNWFTKTPPLVPAWINLNQGTGVLSGIPASSDLGTSTFKIMAKDTTGYVMDNVEIMVEK